MNDAGSPPGLSDVAALEREVVRLRAKGGSGPEAQGRYTAALGRLLAALPPESAPIRRAEVLATNVRPNRSDGEPWIAVEDLDEALRLVWPAIEVAAEAFANLASAHWRLPEDDPARDLDLAAVSATRAYSLSTVVGDRRLRAATRLLLARISLAGRGADAPTRSRLARDYLGDGLALFPDRAAVREAPLEFALLQKGYADRLLDDAEGAAEAAVEAIERLEAAIAVRSPSVDAYQRFWLYHSMIRACRAAARSGNAECLERGDRAARSAAACLRMLERAGPAPRMRTLLEDARGVLELDLAAGDPKRYGRAIRYLERATAAAGGEATPDRKYNLALANRGMAGSPDDARARVGRALLHESLEGAKRVDNSWQAERSAVALAETYQRLGDPRAAADAWREVLAALDAQLALVVVREGRRAELTRQIDLYQRAAYGLLRGGDAAAAVAALEARRGRLSIATVAHDQGALASRAPDLAERFQRDLEAVALHERAQRAAAVAGRADEPAQDVAVEELRSARVALEVTLADIRSLPGLEGFLAIPTSDDLREMLPPDRRVVLVYTAVTDEGSALITVERTGLDTIPLRVTATEVLGQLSRYGAAYSAAAQSPWNPDAQAAWHATIDDLGQWLWDTVVGPLMERVGSAEIVSIAGGWMALLPLHLAWCADAARPSGREYALDRNPISYAASARIINWRPAAIAPTDPAVAVTDPRPTAAEPLGFAREEYALVRAAFPRARRLSGVAAEHEAVKSAIAKASVVHIASHGSKDFAEPLKSGLYLACGGVLTLADLGDLQTPVQIRLAVLSACETALLDPSAPDEPLSLASALTELGVTGVVGSVWQVPELSTLLVMSRFYWEIAVGHRGPQAALHHAQTWVRDTTNAEKAAFFAGSPQPGWVIEPRVASWLRDEMVAKDGDARAYRHPFHWAGFQILGS